MRTIIEKYAHKHRVCPFEFSIDIAYLADAIICDYNYIFDLQVSFKRFLRSRKRTVLLIDEAHNLVDRSRDMFSAHLEKSIFLQLTKAFEKQHAINISKQINDFLQLKTMRCRKEYGFR